MCLERMLSTVVFALLLGSTAAFHIEHRASCQRKRICNGNLMCADVCERGTVEVDKWAVQSLAYQRSLQKEDRFVFYGLPSTHNSAITEADGFGIEKYFISALYGGQDLDQGDDVGEGNCQYLSLTDQLNMGVRHVEVDIWWDPLKHDIVVCHSPIPLYPVNNVTRTAEAMNITLEWDPKKMSCLGTKRGFTEVLTEIRDWMVQPANNEEIVMVYFDTKFRLKPEQVTQANKEIQNVFGNMIWKASEGSPFNTKVSDMLAAGKRIILENAKEDWSHPSEGDQIVFYPTLWNHQFNSNEMTEFPGCVVEGDTNWYGTEWVRALDGSFIEAATRCAVNLASGDYLNPDDMKFYVWSWDQAEPSLADGCVAITPNGRWVTMPCDTQLPYACVATECKESGDYKKWSVNVNQVGSWGSAVCPSGTVFAAPHNGYANSLLVNAGLAQNMWLNAPNPLATKKN
jgi:hypothetical protein